MANIVDSLSQSSMSTVASFFRNLFFFYVAPTLFLPRQPSYNDKNELQVQLLQHRQSCESSRRKILQQR